MALFFFFLFKTQSIPSSPYSLPINPLHQHRPHRDSQFTTNSCQAHFPSPPTAPLGPHLASRIFHLPLPRPIIASFKVFYSHFVIAHCPVGHALPTVIILLSRFRLFPSFLFDMYCTASPCASLFSRIQLHIIQQPRGSSPLLQFLKPNHRTQCSMFKALPPLSHQCRGCICTIQSHTHSHPAASKPKSKV